MNTDTTEPEKSLGQVAFEQYHLKRFEWDKQTDGMREMWEFAAQAVLQQFLSAGPVSGEDLHIACAALDMRKPASRAIAAGALCDILLSRHANPVQAEGGEWRELVKGEIIESGDAWFNGDVYEYTTDLIGEVYADNIRPKVLRRRIPTVQPAVTVSPSLIQSREEQKASSLAASSGAMLSWEEMNQPDVDETEPEWPDVMGVGMRLGEEQPTAAQGQGGTPRKERGKALDAAWERYKTRHWNGTPTAFSRKDFIAGWIASAPPITDLEEQLTASQARVASLEAQCKQHKDNFKKMDSIIDELGVANSCINPFEDLRIAITKLKTERDSLRADLEAMKVRAEKDGKLLQDIYEQAQKLGWNFGKVAFADWLTTQSAEQSKEIERLDKALDQVVIGRDDEGQFGSQLYFLVTGKSPEWSNGFGHEQAEEEVKDALQARIQHAKQLGAERDKALAEVERLNLEPGDVQRDVNELHEKHGLGFHGKWKALIGDTLWGMDEKIEELQLRSRGGVWRILERNERIQEGDYYVPGSGGLVKADKQHWGRQCCEWQVAFMRLESRWRTIIAGDPASLPKAEDGDENGEVLWKLKRVGAETMLWNTEASQSMCAWMPIPPLPTPKASAGDEWAQWKQSVHLTYVNAIAEDSHRRAFEAGKNAARASQAVEGRA